MTTRPCTPRPFSQRLVTLACAAALTGCASPLPRWVAPEPKAAVPQSLDYARAYAMAAREAYRTQIDTQFNNANNLGAGLIGLGAVVAALAAGSVHRDAILGATLLGGSGYAIGQWYLRPQRLLVYQAGVEGMNCALAAVIPFGMSDADLQSLKAALPKIEDQVAATNAAINAATAALAPLRGLQLDTATARDDAAIAAATDAVAQAAKVLPAGRQLASRAGRVGPELISAVDRIAAAVDKALQSTLPDLTSVPKIVAGLAGNAGAFAPGSGVEAAFSKSLAGSPTPKDGTPPGAAAPSRVDIEAKLADLDAKRRDLLATLAVVQGHLAAADSGSSAEALKACGVADLPINMKLSTETLSFPGDTDATRAFIITGGNKPYVVELLDSPTDGFSFKGPVPGESRAQVSVTSALKSGTFSLLVMDSSAQMQSRTVTVSVGAAAAGAAPASGNAPKALAAAATSLDAIAAAIEKQATFTVKASPKDVSLAVKPTPAPAVTAGGKQVEVSFTCLPPPAKPLSQQQVRDAVMSQLPSPLSETIANSMPLGSGHRNLLVRGATNCIAK